MGSLFLAKPSRSDTIARYVEVGAISISNLIVRFRSFCFLILINLIPQYYASIRVIATIYFYSV